MPLACAAAAMRARHLGRIGVAGTGGVVVQVVELADGGEARLQHLHVEPGRDRLDIVGRHPRQEAVHHLAPGPEAVVLRAATLDEARHGALEGVAVHVGHAGHRDAGEALGTGRRRSVGRDGRDVAPLDRDEHVAAPAGLEEGMWDVKLSHVGFHATSCGPA